MEGKIAAVTGAGSGIGRATALLLVRNGARVVAADIDAAAAAETAAIAQGSVLDAQVDVSDEQGVMRLFDECDGRLEPPAVLANIAGIGCTMPAPETPLDVWERVFAVNARGTFLCCKHAVPRMAAAGGGSIVNMASVAGLVALKNRAAYGAPKGAVVALTRALALDHVADGVRVNCICPGTVDSPWVRRLVADAGGSRDALLARQPMGRLDTPEEIAQAVVYVASDAAGFMTGSAIVIDGGLSA